MREIVVISGKGGTGKTSIASAFAQLEGENAIVADCDVDAANMHILLEADFGVSEEFYSGFQASINNSKCIQCSKCMDVCHFDAITDDFIVDELSCEGCGYCAIICPEQAITMKEAYTGRIFVSKTRFNNTLVHARLEIAGENSGKLVSEVKSQAEALAKKKSCGILLIDGSPGIGCPVIASLTKATLALIIAEPSISGYSDMVRLHELISRFGIPAVALINKFDLSKEYLDKIVSFSQQNDIPIIGKVPYSTSFTEAMSQMKTILELSQNEIAGILINAWEVIKNMKL
jgi:MinD superfamily P-loop ATPase